MTQTPSPGPSMEDDPPATLLEATIRLTAQVTKLTVRLDVSERQRRRTRNLQGVVALIFILVLGGGGFQWHRVTVAAKQGCENANDARAASLALWQYVLTLPSQDPTSTPAEVELLARFKVWVEVLYQPHDCDNLDKVYKIPPSPSLTG